MKEKKKSINNKIAIIVIAIGLVAVCTFPYMFSQWYSGISFLETGQIGDTIGGITAPIIGFMGAILVYLAFREQVKANRIIVDQFLFQKTHQYLFERIKMVRDDFEQFTVVRKNLTLSGCPAIQNTLETNSTIYPCDVDPEVRTNTDLLQIARLVEQYDLAYEDVVNSSLETVDKNGLLRILSDHFMLKLYPSIEPFENKRISKNGSCYKCNKKHKGLPNYIFIHYDKHFAIAFPEKDEVEK